MKENTKKGVSRREFLGLSALGLASLTILPSWAIDGVRIAPSDRVVLGFIGLGQQALSDGMYPIYLNVGFGYAF